MRGISTFIPNRHVYIHPPYTHTHKYAHMQAQTKMHTCQCVNVKKIQMAFAVKEKSAAVPLVSTHIYQNHPQLPWMPRLIAVKQFLAKCTWDSWVSKKKKKKAILKTHNFAPCLIKQANIHVQHTCKRWRLLHNSAGLIFQLWQVFPSQAHLPQANW